jgi:hypothetical protein
LTISPDSLRPIILSDNVWGMSDKVNASSVTPKTVRLVPSTAMEPLSITYLKISEEASIS